MSIICISPISGDNPNLFPRMREWLNYTDNPNDATVCFIEAQSGIITYPKELQEVLNRKIDIICFDSREWGAINNEKWYPLDFFCDAYFVRNMDRTRIYPPNVHPFDWPYFSGCDFKPVTKEELFNHPYDIWFSGTESPARKKVIDAIVKDGRLKVNLEYRDHTKRVVYEQWLNEHRQAKLYLSCEGGGFTNERPNQLFSIAPLLNARSNHLPANPFTDGINCIDVNEEPTEGDIEKVIDIISNKEWLYDIYMNGIAHTKKYLSPEGVAKYILEKIKENDS